MNIVVAGKGQYTETLSRYAGTATTVLPHGTDWTPVLTSADPFAELLQRPLAPRPTVPLE
jgi:hypothetical protein